MSKQTRCLACMSEMGSASACPSCGWQMSSELDNALYLPAGYLLNNRYTMGKVIGVGGFGIVYIAWDNNLDIRVAVKEFLPKEYVARSSNHVSITPYPGSADADFFLGVEKFLEEAKALARFQDHPGIVTVHESFRANNTAYMVMQYLDGMTLKEYLKLQPGEKIAFSVAVKALIPIMDALREVHSAGFVHRDISPDNIFLTSQKQVKLLDFGSARYAIGEHSKSLTSVLKHGYAPVEQYSVKGRQGPWSDVYAVCATIYRCVTGFAPLDAMERIQGDTIKTPKQLGIDIPLSGEVALMRGLALKAADRFENIQQLQQALTTGEAQNIIECPKCGAKNRFKPGHDPNALRCGKCKSDLGLNPVMDHYKIKCPNCGYEGAERDDIFSKVECPKCGTIYNKLADKSAPHSAIDLGGYRYIPLKEAVGKAWCLGCRNVDSRNKLYYCHQIGTYYHKECLIKKRGTSPSEPSTDGGTSKGSRSPDFNSPWIVFALFIILAPILAYFLLTAVSPQPTPSPKYSTPAPTPPAPTTAPAPAPTPISPTAVDWGNRAHALYKDGKFTNPRKAIKYLNEAIRLQPNYMDAYFARGVAYSNLGQYKRAIKDYDEAISLKPDSMKFYNSRGLAYSGLKQYQRAIEDYDEAIRLKPDFEWPYYNRGDAYRHLKQYKRAIQDYDETIRLKPNFAWAHNNRGIAYIYSGNNPEGCSSLVRACELGFCKIYQLARQKNICN